MAGGGSKTSGPAQAVTEGTKPARGTEPVVKHPAVVNSGTAQPTAEPQALVPVFWGKGRSGGVRAVQGVPVSRYIQGPVLAPWIRDPSPTRFNQASPSAGVCYPAAGASPLFAQPEMGSVRFRVHKIRRRPWPSAARVRPASVPARTPRGTRTPAMTGRRVARPSLSSPPVLTRRTPTKRTTLRLLRGRRTPLVAYAPSLSCAPPSPLPDGPDSPHRSFTISSHALNSSAEKLPASCSPGGRLHSCRRCQAFVAIALASSPTTSGCSTPFGR